MALAVSLFFSTMHTSPSLLFIDSEQGNSYKLQPIIELLQSLGFSTFYEPLSSVLDESITEESLKNYDALFFLICPQLLSRIDSDCALQFRSLVSSAYSLPHTLIGIALPSFAKNDEKAQSCFELCGLTDLQTEFPEEYVEACEKFISLPLEARTTSYHTSLLPPKKRNQFFANNEKPSSLFFPNKSIIRPLLHSLQPFGVYYYDAKKKNHRYVTSLSLLEGVGIDENFKLMPLFSDEKRQLFALLHESLFELAKQYEKQEAKTVVPCRPPLPNYVENLCNSKVGGEKTKTGWFDLELFSDDKQGEKQKELIDAVLEARLDYLWLSIAPNMYYSPCALKQDKKEEFLKTLARFTALLRQQSEHSKNPIPHLLIGFEIANNLYGENLPLNCARDIYGLVYDDVPNPLDEQFWKNEIELSLKNFMNDYQDASISNGIPMSGVVLDLEMYCRKPSSTGSFLSTMVDSSLSENSYKTYFDKAQQRAEKIGNNIKKTVQKIIPNAFIGCYAPSLSSSWFYLNFYKGLSSYKNPLVLYTFNTISVPHKQWLAAQGVPTKHASVLMLSKFEKPDDLKIIGQVVDGHNGVWFNRFSRIIDDYEKEAWFALEQTPLSLRNRKVFILTIAK